MDFDAHWDHACALYGAMGFSTKFISRKTALTPCQVNYRLHKAKIRRCDYRNGTSDIVKMVLRNSEAPADTLLRSHLRRVFGKAKRRK